MTRIFISHAVSDGAGLAAELVHCLEAAGHACWIAPRNIVPGRTYPAQIMSAIRDARAVVVLLTEAANESADVLQEVQIAHTNRKLIVPVLGAQVTPSDDLGYFVGVRHQMLWTDPANVASALADAIPPAAQPVSTGAPVTMDASTAIARAAASEAGVTGIFSITVRNTDVEGSHGWLNSEVDYRDPRCLGICLLPQAREALRRQLGQDPTELLRGRTIRVHGTAKKRRIDFLSGGVPTGHYYFQTHVEVSDAAQIELAD